MLRASLIRLKIILPLIFLFGICTPLFAQSFLTGIRQYSVEDGLSGRFISDIQEDQQGLFWISTWLGLNRFDGFDFKDYPKEQYGFRSDKYDELLIDSNGNIWMINLSSNISTVNSQKYIDIFNPITETIKNDSILPLLPFPIESIHSLKNDLTNNIWIGLNNGEIYRYDGQDFRRMVKVPVFHQFEISAEYIAILTSTKKEIQFYDLANNLSNQYSINGSLMGMYPDNQGGLFIHSGKEKGKKVTTRWTKCYPKKPAENFRFSSDGTSHLINLINDKEKNLLLKVDAQQNIWIATNKTIVVFNKDFQQIYFFEGEFSQISIYAHLLYFDSHQRAWTASGLGIFILENKKNPFTNFLLSEKLIDTRAIVEDTLGNIYINQTGTYQLNPNTQEIKNLNLEGWRGALVADDGKLYVGMYNNQIHEYDFSTQEIFIYIFKDFEKKKEKFGATYLIFQSQKTGQIYLGTSKNGLYLLHPKQRKISPFLKTNEFGWLQNSSVNCFYETSEGIWLGTSIGLFLLDEEKGIVQHYYIDEEEKSPIGIYDIHVDDANNFWIGTINKGLWKWTPDKKTSLHLTTENGLSDNTIYAIYEDEAGFLWLPSNQGLMQMKKTTLEIKTYLPSDGIPHVEFNNTSHLRASDGRLYFGGLKGVTSFYPSDFHQKDNLASPTPHISEIQTLDGNTGKWKIITQDFKKNGFVTLKSQYPTLKIQLAAFNYSHPDKNQYAYRLKEKKDWIFIEKNILTLKDLPYGNSNIKIRGRVTNGDWSEIPLKISLLRHHPFYYRTPFLIGVLLSLVIFGFIIWKRQQKFNAKREQKIKEAISAIRESLAPPAEEVQQPAVDIKEKEKEKSEKTLPASASDEWLKVLNQKANQLIDDGKFSITELAESMNLSERQFRRRLKQKTDMVPKAYLNEIRLQKAKQLLILGAYPTVAEVCYAVGFATPKHFSKIFQERFGNNPSFYLDKNSGKQNS